MEDRFPAVRFLVIGDTEEEAQAALGLLEENLPVVAFTAPELAKDGKYVAQAETEVLIEEVERFRELNRLEELKKSEA